MTNTESTENIDNEVTLYRTEEVAELCQVTTETVRNWIKDKKLKAILLGQTWRIKRGDLIEFLNERYGS